MAQNQGDDSLAYGDYSHGSSHTEASSYEGGERGIIGDTFRKLRGDNQNNPTSRPSGGPPHPSSLGAGIFDKLHNVLQGIGSEISQNFTGQGETHSHTHTGTSCDHGVQSQNRYGSFANPREGNDIKWYVDGCGYMWAVSRALEQAQTSIWILDWWLSPELYLRRPPSKNEQYRIDRMLQVAAQRGVKVNIIVYKEVTQALTRKYLSPTLPKYLHSLLPQQTDAVTSTLSALGLAATFASLEHMEAESPLIIPPVAVSSSHTKHALEDLHPNISVFRHPDHLPDAQTLGSSFLSSLQNFKLNAATASKLPGDALKAIYGMNDDVILYWAHHEKLCVVDGRTAFMGGLDLCYGRWDTNQHPIADAHPGNLDDIVYPGQDYNNARIMDFQDVAHWQNNKLDRKENSRIGWSDISVSVQGPVVEDLRAHFVERWNFIYNEKYSVREDTRYSRLTFKENMAGTLPSPSASTQYTGMQGSGQAQAQYGGNTSSIPNQDQAQPPSFPAPPTYNQDNGRGSTNREGQYQDNQTSRRRRLSQEAVDLGSAMRDRFMGGVQYVQDKYLTGNDHYSRLQGSFQGAGITCQIVRSCTKWSHGVPTEHSIANAYIEVIRNSQHFVYIENQFFITATSDDQKPVRNKIGAAIVERVVSAARAGQKYKVIVLIPAVPGFAGDLKDESSLGTRAIMEFQYQSINRGGHSIMEVIAKEGLDPTQYIRFYNLRNYDRINASAAMREAEQKSGVDYELARREHDDRVDPAGYRTYGGENDNQESSSRQNYNQYQKTAAGINPRQGLGTGRWDTVSECYMLGGLDIREVPWENGDISEMDAFVSEELYIHSKVLIADDRIVICGSANFNDRSQLGTHDSEIAIIVEDPAPIESSMNGQPWRASKFAATLRRQLFRKHLGLLRPQDMARPDQNFEPVGVPNTYDFGSEEDRIVADPLSDKFLNLWNSRARQNTDTFAKIFHPVPHDSVRTWKDYDAFYEVFFHEADKEADGKTGTKKPAKYRWGHVVAENFSHGDQGVREVKDLLSTIRGTLVEMPLQFLIMEDIAKEGVSLNAFTEEVYT